MTLWGRLPAVGCSRTCRATLTDAGKFAHVGRCHVANGRGLLLGWSRRDNFAGRPLPIRSGHLLSGRPRGSSLTCVGPAATLCSTLWPPEICHEIDRRFQGSRATTPSWPSPWFSGEWACQRLRKRYRAIDSPIPRLLWSPSQDGVIYREVARGV